MPARVAIAFALVLAACASAAPELRPPAGESAAEIGYRQLLAMEDLEGAPVTAVDHPTVVVFFASWCSHCRRELEVLGELAAEIPALRVLGVNAYEDWGELSDELRLRRYVAEHAPFLQVVHGDDALLELFGGVPKIPTVFVYDAEGRVVSEFRRGQRSPPNASELRRAIAVASGR